MSAGQNIGKFGDCPLISFPSQTLTEHLLEFFLSNTLVE